jgi:hypothetical protein
MSEVDGQEARSPTYLARVKVCLRNAKNKVKGLVPGARKPSECASFPVAPDARSRNQHSGTLGGIGQPQLLVCFVQRPIATRNQS